MKGTVARIMIEGIIKGAYSGLLPQEAPVMNVRKAQVLLFSCSYCGRHFTSSCYEQPKDEQPHMINAEPGTDSVPVHPSKYGLTELLCIAGHPAQLSAHPQ